MGRKIQPYIGESFSSLADSPLGQILKQLQKILMIQKGELNSSGDSSLESKYSLNQLTTFESYLKSIESLLTYYSEGKRPEGLWTEGSFVAEGGFLYNKIKNTTVFFTPAYSFYKIVKDNLLSSINSILNANKIRSITVDNIDSFKDALKKQLRSMNFEKISTLPGCDLPGYFRSVDLLIDAFEFSQYNKKNAVNAKFLNEEFIGEVYNYFFEMNDFIHDADYSIFALQITHPSVYNFVIEALELLSEAPLEFKQMASFLDPNELAKGALLTLINTLTPVAVEYTPQQQSQYIYTIKMSEEEDRPLDLSKLYTDSLPKVRDILTKSLGLYFDNYQDSSHVKSELAKMQLIAQFVEVEKKLDKECLENADNALSLLNNREEETLSLENKIKALSKRLAFIKSSTQQITDLQQRKENYAKKSVAALIAAYEGFDIKIQAAKQEGLDLSYLDQPLPNILLPRNAEGKCILVDVQQELTIDDFKNLLTKKDIIAETIPLIEKQLETLLTQWFAQELERHALQNGDYVSLLQEIVSDAEAIGMIDELSLPHDVDERLTLVEGVILALDEKLQGLSRITQQLMDLQQTINNPILCDEELRSYCFSFSQNVARQYQSSREEVKQSLQRVEVYKANVTLKKEQLMAELKKARIAKALKETMQSSDPSKIITLKEEKETQNKNLLQNIKDHEEELRAQSEQKIAYAQLLNSKAIGDLGKEISQISTKLAEEFRKINTSLLRLDSNINKIFSEENLGTVEGIQTAEEKLRTLVAQGDEVILVSDEQAAFMFQYLNAFRFTAKTIEDNKSEFPFALLDSNLKEMDIGGFNSLLEHLKDPNHTKSVWDKHRKAKTSGEKEAVTLAATKLLTLINNKIKDFFDQIAAQERKQIVSENAETLRILINQLQSLSTTLNDRDRLKHEREVYLKEQEELKERELVLVKLLEGERAELQNSTASIAVLATIADLLKKNLFLNQEMSALETLILESDSVELLNQNQEKLNESILSVKEKLARLKHHCSELEIEVGSLLEKEIYQENLENIYQSLSATDSKINEAVNAVINPKLEILSGLSKQAEDTLSLIERGARLLAEQSGNPEKLNIANEILSTTFNFNESIPQLSSMMQHLEADKILNSAQNRGIDTLVNQINLIAYGKILTENEVLAEVKTLLDNFAKELSDLRTSLNSLFKNAVKRFYDEDSARFNGLISGLHNFPNAEFEALKYNLEQLGLEEAKPLLGKLEGLTKLVTDLKEQAKVCEKDQRNLAASIATQRTELVDQFKNEFTTYIRNRNQRYAIRDRLFSTEGVERADFVRNLAMHLDTYAENGNSQVIFDYLAARGRPFVGFNLQPLINRLSLDIKALDEEEREVNDEQVFETLKELRSQNPEFIAKVDRLYEKIYLIYGLSHLVENQEANDNNEGFAVQKLAQSLTQQVDLFFVNHRESLIEPGNLEKKQALFTQFQTDFVCRLHSQDNILSKYYSWSALAANIASLVAAVFTLGISAGITAATTKLVTGRASIFYKPDGLYYSDQAEKVLEEVVQTMAPAA